MEAPNVQTPTLIEDKDRFVGNVLAVQDSYRIDDDLEELKYFAFTVLANRMVKFSGLFPTERAAIERVQNGGTRNSIFLVQRRSRWRWVGEWKSYRLLCSDVNFFQQKRFF